MWKEGDTTYLAKFLRLLITKREFAGEVLCLSKQSGSEGGEWMARKSK